MTEVTITSESMRTPGGIGEIESPPGPDRFTPGGGHARDPISHWPTRLLDSRHEGWKMGLPFVGDANENWGPMPVMVAVGGGKGGVGKSLVSANLATRLALSGRKVLAVDLDIGGSNLHTYFGMQSPKKTLADALSALNSDRSVDGASQEPDSSRSGLSSSSKALADAILPTPINNVFLLAGGREESWGGLANCGPELVRNLMEAIFHFKQSAGVEFVIFDLGAGTNPFTLDVFSVANLGLVTVLPEPTSIENAYMFLKTSLFRTVEHVGHATGNLEGAEAVRQALLEPLTGGATQGGYAEKLRRISNQQPEFIRNVSLALSGRIVGFTINQVRSQKDIDIGKSMEVIGNRYFGYQTRFCGFLNYDDAAWKALRNRRMVVADFPHSVLSRRFSDLVRVSMANLGF